MGLDGVACFGLVFGLPVALVVGAVALRAAVSIANRTVGPPKERTDPFADWDWDGDWEDEKPRRSAEKAIPEPGLGKGMMVSFAVVVLTAFIGAVLGVLAEAVADDLLEGDEGARVALLALFTLPLGFVGAALVFAATLPTTFSRAALVAVVYHFFALVLAAVVVGSVAVALHL
ncbi:MAG: hypothetical protein J0I06_00475 [Planctomycetes bacterium]|nr:hypothetical protein [Planctomycetota bacterium]